MLVCLLLYQVAIFCGARTDHHQWEKVGRLVCLKDTSKTFFRAHMAGHWMKYLEMKRIVLVKKILNCLWQRGSPIGLVLEEANLMGLELGKESLMILELESVKS